MTLSVITTDNLALSAGLPFPVHPDDCSFSILLGQESDGTFRPVQTSGGTLAGSGGGGGGGGGTSSTVTLAGGTASAGTFALSAGGTVAVAGTVPVTRADVAGTLTVAAATANAAATVSLANGVSTVAFAVSGLTASAGAMIVEGTNNGGTTWSSVNAIAAGTGILSSALTADGQFSVAAAGRTAVRLRMTSTGTGTITVASNASVGTRDVALAAPLPPGSNALGTVAVSGGTLTLSTGNTVTVLGTFWQTTQPVSLAGTSAVSGTLSLSTGQTITLAGSNTVTLATGTSNIGTIAGSSANIPTYLQAVSSGGCSLTSYTNAATAAINTLVKASAGNVFGYDISNSGTAGVWVRLFATSTAVTLGVGTPIMRLYVPPASARAGNLDVGAYFTPGIAVTATAGAADTDTSTIATAGQVEVNLFWK